MLPSKKFLLDLLKDKNLYKLAEKMTISKNELLEMSKEAQENYLKEIKVEDCLDIHLDSMDTHNIKFIGTTLTIASDVTFNNISFNSDATLMIEAGRSLNIAGLLTLGSNIVSKGIIENINNGQSVIHKGITSEILLNNTIALNLNFMEENTDSNSDITILGNTDPEI
ncbi:hypothetical protein [Rickettsia helvetica]|uniref:MinC-C domain-containing protein n=1 Tax=Rickettsia helvetica TaxID=35789 RepID=A0ABM9N9N8_RICHE|nr:hypothetical protein [Rickettsia helvetica]MCZ6884535.1 hypothetical protein [Rickettsia endosymbiont of Ixodes ricinus]MCZ6896177.1 hypothetical protein [Rickettsia endosymbiont of Ixodes ricinus]